MPCPPQGPGKRGVVLERMCQEYVGEFENDLVQLTALNARLQRRIDLTTRYKDAVSKPPMSYARHEIRIVLLKHYTCRHRPS